MSRQPVDFEDEDTLVWIGPSADIEDGVNDDFEDEEVTAEFIRPDLPEPPVASDRDTLVSASPFQGPPPVEVERLEPVSDPDIPDPDESDSSRADESSV